MHLISLSDWPRERIEATLRLAIEIKATPARYRHALEDRELLMIFAKPSLRTRVSFEAAILQLGGHAIHYDLAMSPWAQGKESPADTARTVSRYVDAVMARLFSRADMNELAAHSGVPVINGLTNFEHPCQALGDLMTLLERHARLAGLRLAYVGDANNNVTHSLLDGCARCGVHLAVACPASADFRPSPVVLERAGRFARDSGAEIRVVHDAREAVKGACAVYTDTWMSYHIPKEQEAERRRALEPFRVTEALMADAGPQAAFLHCLPAQRGMEVTAEVMDGPRSLVFEQAENRLHSEKAVLIELIGGPKGQ